MSKGKLYVTGIGPGSYEDMTVRAVRTLERCDCIAGYTVYCDLVRPYFPGKEYISTAMMGEEKRVLMALQKASEGSTVALICSGDAGVYGMASLALKMAQDYPEVSVEVIPGVTAALSGGAILGAPLIHDFCLISLSDRLTPWEIIEKRIRAAAEADFVIVLYNPESKSRSGFLAKACDILLEKIEPSRVCGIADKIGRDGENKRILDLKDLKTAKADMFSTVFIGNSTTRCIEDVMITARGYKSEK